MFLRNGWYVAAVGDEIKDKPLARTLLDEPVVLYRDKDGAVHALEDRCCHRGAPLSLGWTTERGLMCGYHGLEFDGTGTCVNIPGHQGKIPERARVRSYPVVEKIDYVWIWMGDPARADASQIVTYPPDDANWPRANDMLHVKATYVMLLENLMDLSHLSYLHKDSIGSDPEDSANAKMDVTGTGTGVKFLRVMRNASLPNGFAQRYDFGCERIDRWSEFEYVAPSHILQWTGVVKAGTYDEGNRTEGVMVRVLHTITPETERSCHYFFNSADGTPAFSPNGKPKNIPRTSKEIFREDCFMLENQQKRIEGYDIDKLLDIPSDVARVQMIRFLNRKIQEEQEQSRIAAE
jgi:vanillate O-demethylase monooxygenase subunit